MSRWICGVSGLVLIVLTSSPTLGSISQQFFLSDTNKLYYVVATDQSSGSIGAQVTSMVMTSGTAVPLNETPDNPPDPVVTSFGTFFTGAILHSLMISSIVRTELITGLTSSSIQNANPCNPVNGCFDPHANGGDGLLTLPGGLRTVAFDGSGTEPLTSITNASGSGNTLVPAAAITSFVRRIGNTTFNATSIVFPNPPGSVVTSNGSTCAGGMNPGAACDPGNGNVECMGGGTCTNFGGAAPGQNVTIDNALGERIGNPASQGAAVDGFFLPDTSSLIVFLVDDGAAAFGLTADGFSVTGTCSNADVACVSDIDCVGGTCTEGLSSRNVVNTTGDVDNSRFLPTPTSTPTNTPTVTVTPTSTATNTATQTNTATVTNTPTNTSTATATNTATVTTTSTRTVTATATNTATATATATRTLTATATPTRSSVPTSTPTATPSGTDICRTKGFWGQHACPESQAGVSTCEKDNSQNITQEVIDAAGGSISVCGKLLTNTRLNTPQSAEEALCVNVQGEQILQLASQLTAAALNCVISGHPNACAGSSLATTFQACNMACAAGQTSAIVNGKSIDCVTAIDCANNGGAFNVGTGSCGAATAGSCHTQPLCNEAEDLCFEPPGPAGASGLCNDAIQNSCTIFSTAAACAPASQSSLKNFERVK